MAAPSTQQPPGSPVRLPVFCTGMTPISQPKLRPATSKATSKPQQSSSISASSSAAAYRSADEWANQNAWVMGGSLVHHSPRHSPRHAGGNTQRRLKTGKVTEEQLEKEFKQRAVSAKASRNSEHSKALSIADQKRREGSPTAGNAWQTNMLEEGTPAYDERLMSRREKAAAKEAAKQAEKEAKAEALAQRVAEVNERLAQRQEYVAQMRRKRHQKFIEQRLNTGLTAVLYPADPLTKRAIALGEANRALIDALVPLNDFDAKPPPLGESPLAPQLSSSSAAASRRDNNRHHSQQSSLTASSATAGANGVSEGAERVRMRAEARRRKESEQAIAEELSAMVAVRSDKLDRRSAAAMAAGGGGGGSSSLSARATLHEAATTTSDGAFFFEEMLGGPISSGLPSGPTAAAAASVKPAQRIGSGSSSARTSSAPHGKPQRGGGRYNKSHAWLAHAQSTFLAPLPIRDTRPPPPQQHSNVKGNNSLAASTNAGPSGFSLMSETPQKPIGGRRGSFRGEVPQSAGHGSASTGGGLAQIRHADGNTYVWPSAVM